MINNLIKVFVRSLIGLLVISMNLAYAENVANIDLVFQRINEQDPKAAFPNQDVSCEVTIDEPQDSRFNKDNFGVNFIDEPVVSKHSVTDWLRSSLIGMDTIGVKTTTDNRDGNISVSTKLNRMYVWNHGLRLFATLSLDAKFIKAEGIEITKNYRVTGSKINWAGTDSELATTINISVNRLIEQIAIDLASQCNKS